MRLEEGNLNQEISIQSEYERDYSEKSTKIKLLLESAIISRDLETVKKAAAAAEEIKDLKLFFDEELDILKLYIASTITSFVETAIQQGLPKDVAENAKREYYVSIVNSSSRVDLECTYFQAVEELIKAMEQYSMKQYSPLVKMAIEYIHNNKFRFIYSKDVSEAIRVNRSYLSKLFKMETGQNLTDYIHKVKIDYAIKLMESNFYKYNEIAEILGYRNYSYFSSVFKKIIKKTPNEFMKESV